MKTRSIHGLAARSGTNAAGTAGLTPGAGLQTNIELLSGSRVATA